MMIMRCRCLLRDCEIFANARLKLYSTDDPPDVVHGDVGGVDEGDWDAGGVEAGEVEPDQEVPARVHLDGADLRGEDIYIIYSSLL